MSKFSDKSWEERKKTLGQPAEQAFERFARRHNIEFDRYGFDDSPIDKFYMLPEIIRFTPDYACVGKSPFLVECKGTGYGKYATIKVASLAAVGSWNFLCSTYLFFYDSHEKKVALISYNALDDLVVDKEYEHGEWVDDGVVKPYIKIPKSDLTWEDDSEVGLRSRGEG